MSLALLACLFVASQAWSQAIPQANIVDVRASTAHWGYAAWNAVDGNTEVGSAGSGWMNSGNADEYGIYDDTPWISFTFDKVYNVDSLTYWNYILDNENGRGLRSVNIWVSTDDVLADGNFSFDPGDGRFTLLGNSEFSLSGTFYNSADDPHQLIIDATGVGTRTIVFQVMENWFGRVFWEGASYEGPIPHTSRVGLSEIQFHYVDVPEPATMGLLTLGGLALLRRKR